MKWRTYPRFRDSGVEWLGEVPEDWDTQRLKYCAQLINEKVEGSGTELPYLGLEHIESWTGKRIVTAEPSSSEGQSNRIRQGDVLFGKLRPYLAKVHRASEEGICTGELLVLKPRCVVQDFLFYYMLSKDFISVVDSSTYGAKMPRASWEFIGNLPTLVPSQNEQRAIAAFLDRETGRIDALMEKKQRQIELLQEKRSALISHAVTKGLDPTAPLKDSGVPWLTGVPQEWEVAPLGRVAPLQRGHDLPSEVRKSGNIPVVSSAGIVDYHSIPKAEGPGVITGRYGTIGEVFYVANDYWPLNTTLYVYDFRENHPRYIYYLILILPFSAHSDKSAVPGVNRNHLHPLLVLKPPIENQKAIAEFLDQETAKIDVLIVKIQESIDRLKEYRTALISAAVTGKIDVRGAGI